LDRLFGDAQVRGDLLVQQTRDDLLEDLALPRREGRGTPAHQLPRGIELLVAAALNDGAVYRVQELVELNGLGEEIDGALQHRTHGGANVPVPGDEDDGASTAGEAQPALHVEARQIRHEQVDNQARGGERIDVVEERAGGRQEPGV